jgi:DNA polymerase elongation subunit (family B)
MNRSRCILDIETTSFQPWSGRIICIGIKDACNGDVEVFYDDDEESLLMQFFRYVNKKQYDEIIGYNLAFDMRFIFARCLLYKIPTYGFFDTIQTDLMMILKNVQRGYNYNQPGTLNDWAIGILGKRKPFENTEVPELYAEDRIQDLIEYNQNDLELTYELWMRVELVLQSM